MVERQQEGRHQAFSQISPGCPLQPDVNRETPSNDARHDHAIRKANTNRRISLESQLMPAMMHRNRASPLRAGQVLKQ